MHTRSSLCRLASPWKTLSRGQMPNDPSVTREGVHERHEKARKFPKGTVGPQIARIIRVGFTSDMAACVGFAGWSAVPRELQNRQDDFRAFFVSFVDPFSAAFPLGFLLRQALSLRSGKILELLFAHGFRHLPRSAFQGGLAAFATFRGESCSRRHLLFLGFCRHVCWFAPSRGGGRMRKRPLTRKGGEDRFSCSSPRPLQRRATPRRRRRPHVAPAPKNPPR